jgi:hypothetical protein
MRNRKMGNQKKKNKKNELILIFFCCIYSFIFKSKNIVTF